MKIHNFNGIYQERRWFSWAMLVSWRVDQYHWEMRCFPNHREISEARQQRREIQHMERKRVPWIYWRAVLDDIEVSLYIKILEQVMQLVVDDGNDDNDDYYLL